MFQLFVDHLVNRANLGDPFGMAGRSAFMVVQMLKHEYVYYRRILPKRKVMRANYPNKRLTINGEFTVH